MLYVVEIIMKANILINFTNVACKYNGGEAMKKGEELITKTTSIKVDYNENRKNPSEVFESLAKVVDSFYRLDQCLLHVFHTDINVKYEIESIELGSIRAKIKSILELIDDDALKELDYKKMIGSFLVKGKHYLLKKVQENSGISSTEQIQEHEEGIIEIAKEEGLTPVFSLPTYNVITNISNIYITNASLDNGESIAIEINGEEVILNKRISISQEHIEALMIKNTIESESIVVLRIKKPDYLGKSKWSFYFEDRVIEAKILDLDWLENFQNQEVDIRPKDSIRAKMISKIDLADNGIIMREHHEILEVVEVIKYVHYTQLDLF